MVLGSFVQSACRRRGALVATWPNEPRYEEMYIYIYKLRMNVSRKKSKYVYANTCTLCEL